MTVYKIPRTYRSEHQRMKKADLSWFVNSELSLVDERSQEVLRLRAGVSGNKLSLEQVGERLGVGPARVLQIQNVAMWRINKHRLRDPSR